MADLQDGHKGGKPQFLGSQQRMGIGPPDTQLEVVGVAQNHKGPCRRQTQPADKPVVPLKGVVVIVADPGKGAQNGNHDTDIGNDTCGND